MFRFSYRFIASLLVLIAVQLTPAQAAESVSISNGLTAAGGPLAIHGFDPVSYFDGGSPERGLAEFSAKHSGAVYRFASRENMRRFVRNPEEYAPQFGGFCAYGVSVGKKFDGDPQVYRMVDDKLYFNLNPEIKAIWEKDLSDNLRKAGSNWPKIRSKAASSL